MSPFYFHWVYVAMMGETLAETIRRRRLHAAAETAGICQICPKTCDRKWLLKDVHIEDLPSIPMLSPRHLGDYQSIGIAFEK
jgi:hypothetical protein